MVEVLIVGQLSTNCYLFYDPKTRESFVIDPGDDAEYIINKITDLGLKPEAIIATHGHFDHILAVTELKLAYNIPFYTHRGDIAIVNRMQNTAKYFTGIETDPAPKINRTFSDGSILKAGNLTLKVIHTPGHTSGSVCLYSSFDHQPVKGEPAEQENIVFTGDTIFFDGNYGRTDLIGGDAKKLKESILKILSLPENTLIYSGHGDKTSVKKEKRFYRFLS